MRSEIAGLADRTFTLAESLLNQAPTINSPSNIGSSVTKVSNLEADESSPIQDETSLIIAPKNSGSSIRKVPNTEADKPSLNQDETS